MILQCKSTSWEGVGKIRPALKVCGNWTGGHGHELEQKVEMLQECNRTSKSAETALAVVVE